MIFLVTLLFLPALAGCMNEPVIPVDLEKRADVQVVREEGVITYAYLP
jgi:hypothetical protein